MENFYTHTHLHGKDTCLAVVNCWRAIHTSQNTFAIFFPFIIVY